MASDRDALLDRADTYARDLDEYYEDSVICNNARECINDLAAAVRDLQVRLDARGRDLAKFTQSTVANIKALEQECNDLRTRLAAVPQEESTNQ